MKMRLKQKLGTVLIGGLILYNLASQNGILDSMRTKEARRYISSDNSIKTVANVEEKWKNYWSCTPMLDDYNPRVIRKVTFKDGSKTRLDYRILAWQPFVRWKNGEEFNPRPEEKYEVTSWNQIVRRVN